MALRVCVLFPFAVGLLSFAGGGVAQQRSEPRGEFGDHVQVRVVNVDVFVTDREGRSIVDLDEGDFELFIGGEKVEITNFYAQNGPPPAASSERSRPAPGRSDGGLGSALGPSDQRGYVLVLVDHSQIRRANRERVLSVLEDVVATRLRPSDAVTVVSYSGSLRVHADFSSDRRAIAKIFDEIREISAGPPAEEIERRRILSELGRGSSGGLLGRNIDGVRLGSGLVNRIRAYAESRYQSGRSSIEALHRIVAWMGGLPGRKSLIYVSDGIVNRPGEDLFVAWRDVYGQGSPQAGPGNRRIDFNTDYEREIGRYDLLADLRQVAALANETGVTLYAVDAEPDHASGVRDAGVEFGASSEATSIIDTNYREPLEFVARATGGVRIQSASRLEDELGRLARDLSTYYSLGFSARAEDADRPRGIEVKVKQKGLVVRHRETFQLQDADEVSSARVLAALLFDTTVNPLGFRLEPEQVHRREDGTTVLPTRVIIPLQRVTLVPDEGVYRAQLSIFVTVRKASGDAAPVQKLPVHLDIPAERIDEAIGDAAHYPLPVVLRPGDRQVAVGVRDDYSSVTSMARFDVTGL